MYRTFPPCTYGDTMITISATKLRSNLFELLDKVSEGETLLIKRNKHEVARIVPVKQPDWRDKMSIHPKLLVSPDEIIGPMEDVWEDYV